MFVKLPRPCSGKELINSFTSAASFEEFSFGDLRTWKPEQLPEYQYLPSSIHQEIRNMGVRAYPAVFRRKFIFFGKKGWFEGVGGFIFTLKSVKPDGIYKEVEVSIEYGYSGDDRHWYSGVDPQPNEEAYQLAKIPLEKLVVNFYAGLSN